MKRLAVIAGVLALANLGLSPFTARAAESEGVAVAIVYDTSGSMKDPVRDSKGQNSPKYLIANRALTSVAEQLQAFAGKAGPGTRTVHCSLYTFNNDQARRVMALGPLDAEALKRWAKGFANPSGSTPLGNTLDAACKELAASPLPRKHVLVVTDGLNTAGPAPTATLPKWLKPSGKSPALAVHFVAFDIDANQFSGVKKLGATVVSAADEKQLNTQLDYILQQKILLEDEEPKKN